MVPVFRFSGITKELMKGVNTTLQEVQAVLLSMFSAKTILIGHSLESDLMSVKVRTDECVQGFVCDCTFWED